MKRKLPAEEAFAHYLGLGPGRSYEAVAKQFGVTKKAVTNLATKEKWQERIARIEDEARRRADEKAVESISSMNERHLRVMQFVQGKAIEALKAQPIETAMEALKAYTLSLQTERLIRGEPSERINVEEIIRSEFAELTAKDEDDGGKPVQASPVP